MLRVLMTSAGCAWAAKCAHPALVLTCLVTPPAGGFPDAVARVCQLIDESCTSVDWVDINMGCPIDIVRKGMNSAAEGPCRTMHASRAQAQFGTNVCRAERGAVQWVGGGSHTMQTRCLLNPLLDLFTCARLWHQVCDRGAGSALLLKPKKIEDIARAADRAMSLPLTLKTRKGYYDDNVSHSHNCVTHYCHMHPLGHAHPMCCALSPVPC